MAVSITRSNPPTVRQPTGYTHAIDVRNAERRLVISGQVGMAVDGTVPETGGGQIDQALANLRAVLEANDMTVINIVKLTVVFLTDRSLIGAYRAARTAFLGEHAPASTLLFVAGLADPRFVVEIEAEAVAVTCARGVRCRIWQRLRPRRVSSDQRRTDPGWRNGLCRQPIITRS